MHKICRRLIQTNKLIQNNLPAGIFEHIQKATFTTESTPSLKKIQLLRERTGIPITQCKKALIENSGDVDKAILYLLETYSKNIKVKPFNELKEGLIAISRGEDRISGIKLGCQTDFTAKSTQFVNSLETILDLWDTNLFSYTQGIKMENKREELRENSSIDEILKIVTNQTSERCEILEAVGYTRSKNEIIGVYIHQAINHIVGKKGSIVILKGNQIIETQSLANDLAMHATAMIPNSIEDFLLQEYIYSAQNLTVKEIIEEKEKEFDCVLGIKDYWTMY